MTDTVTTADTLEAPQKKAGLDPVFDPIKLGIRGADAWTGENPPAAVAVARANSERLEAREADVRQR